MGLTDWILTILVAFVLGLVLAEAMGQCCMMIGAAACFGWGG